MTPEELLKLADMYLDGPSVPGKMFTHCRQLAQGYVALSAQVAAHDAAHEQALVEARCQGHGDGQMHAIADVNAGLVDDMIQARLSALQAQDAARGEIIEVCPHCGEVLGPKRKADPESGTLFDCWNCSATFEQPAFYQRLLAPPRQPAHGVDK